MMRQSAKRFREWVALCIGIILLTGCAGTYFTFDKARQVQLGMTESELNHLMGKPNVVTSSGGHVKWVYAYGNGFGTGRSVSFVFTDGKVTEVPSIPESFK